MNGIHLYETRHRESYALNTHHHSYDQLLYVIEGEGRIAFANATYELERDCAVRIPPHAEHTVSSQTRMTLLVLSYDEAQLGGPPRGEADETPPLALRMNPAGASELRRLLRKLLFEQGRDEPLRDWAMKLYLQEILLLLARAKGAGEASDANLLRAERMRNYIDQHYYEPLTAADLAAKLGVGVRHANDIFKERYGMTPIRYLTEARIRIAKGLLEETDKDIASICFEVGYESLPTFYRTFKNETGMSPNQFRLTQGD